MKERLTILCGDALEQLRALPEGSVQCCVTSPPYWGLRDYGVTGQIGLERTPEEYVERLVEVFHEVRRVLRADGTCWVNLGDCYIASGCGGDTGKSGLQGTTNGQDESKRARAGQRLGHRSGFRTERAPRLSVPHKSAPALKAKDLVGIPWRVAFALQADGWWLRQENIWAKPNPRPESVTDRTTRAHETMFHLSKSARYFYDAGAIREPASPALIKQIKEGYNGHSTKDYLGALAQDPSETKRRIINGYRKRIDKQRGHSRKHAGFNDRWDKLTKEEQRLCMANKRTVWTIPCTGYTEAHFATFPEALVRPCILAGCPAGGLVLDPFAGSGTTGKVALELGRHAVLIELNPDDVKLIERRCDVTPGLALA